MKEACKRNNVSIAEIYDLKGDIDEGKRVIKNIKDDKLRPDLILTVGILATTLVKEQFTDIPIIFCMVINHERFNLEGANVTGISSEASIRDQFGVLKELLGTSKNVGVIYDPKETGSIISEAASIVGKSNFNLVKTEVTSEDQVAPALKNIVNKIDALWIVPDGTVVTKESLEIILKMGMKHRLPVFCTSSAIVRAGALVSISPDYRQTGIQAAQLAQTLLNNSTVISLGVKQPDKLKVTLNTQTAGIIRVDISPFDPGVMSSYIHNPNELEFVSSRFIFWEPYDQYSHETYRFNMSVDNGYRHSELSILFHSYEKCTGDGL